MKHVCESCEQTSPPLWVSFLRCWAGTLAMFPSFCWWSCRVALRKIDGWDWAARTQIKRWAGPGWAPVSRLGDGWVYAGAVLWLVHYGWFAAGEHVGACVGLAWCLSGAAKYSFRRLRPDAQTFGKLHVRENKLARYRWKRFDFYGFPSQHVACAVAFAMGTRNPAAWAFALLVAISRIAVGAHFPGDVLAGVAVGLAAGVWG